MAKSLLILFFFLYFFILKKDDAYTKNSQKPYILDDKSRDPYGADYGYNFGAKRELELEYVFLYASFSNFSARESHKNERRASCNVYCKIVLPGEMDLAHARPGKLV